MTSKTKVAFVALLAMPLVGFASAQEGEKPKTIPATPLIAPGSQGDAKQEKPQTPEEAKYSEIVGAFDKATKDFAAKRRAAKPEEREAIAAQAPDPAPTAEALMRLATEYPGSPVALKSLIWIYGQNGLAGKPVSTRASELLVANHLESPDVATICRLVIRREGNEKGRSILEAIAARNSSKGVQAQALMALAASFEQTGEGADPDPDKAIALYERVVKEFAGVEDPRGVTYASRAQGFLFEKRNLQVGMTAPEIENEDTDGVSFKLSDYRGKVVLLDFWGHW